MTQVALDIEADGLDPTRVWCICTVNLDTDEVKTYDERTFDIFRVDARDYTLVVGHNLCGYDLPVLRRLVGWEVPSSCRVVDTLVLSHLLKYEMDGGHSLEAWGVRLNFLKLDHNDFSTFTSDMLEYCVNDTKLSAKLYKYLKGRLPPSFDKAIEVEHAVQDILQRDVKEGGFPYDKAKADYLRSRVLKRVEDLDALILASFPPRAVPNGTYVPKLTRHGTISRTNLRWYQGTDYSVFTPGCECVRISWELFNPGSVKQVVTRLTDNGWWEPTERTDGYIEAQRTRNREKLAKLDKYGWKLSESNLSTLKSTEQEELWVKECRVRLPRADKNIRDSITKQIESASLSRQQLDIGLTLTRLEKRTCDAVTELVSKSLNEWLMPRMDAAPFVENERNSWSITVTQQGELEACYAQSATATSASLNVTLIAQQRISGLSGARYLVERLALNSRLTMLDTWERAYNYKTKSLHPTINGIGTWSHRSSHNNPNIGNIATAKTIKYKEPKLAKQIIQLGACTRSLFHTKHHWQVGCDADGIQLRVFAHYTGDKALIEALVNGDKSNGTDLHSLNKAALGDVCRTRDDAKTWIYAYLLGAGDAKLALILKCDLKRAKQAKENLLKTYSSISDLRKERIPRDAARGYFEALDGRYICCSSEHLMLAGYLQSGESLIMKYAMVKAKRMFQEEDIDARLLAYVHDETQWMVKGTRAEAERAGQIQAECIAWAGDYLNCLCPQKGNYQVGHSWLDCH